MTYSVHQAKTHFSKLLDLAEEGEEVLIIRHGVPIVRLVPEPKPKKPIILGTMRGRATWVEGWEQAMSGEEAAEWEAPIG